MFQKTKTIKINNLHKDFKGKLDILQTFYVKCLAYAGNPLTPHQILKKVGDKNKINQTFDFLLFPLYTDPSNVQRVDHIQFVSEALKSIENMRLIKSEIY